MIANPILSGPGAFLADNVAIVYLISFVFSFGHGHTLFSWPLLAKLVDFWGFGKLSTDSWGVLEDWFNLILCPVFEGTDGWGGDTGNSVEKNSWHFSSKVRATLFSVWMLGIFVYTTGRVYLAAENTSFPVAFIKKFSQCWVLVLRIAWKYWFRVRFYLV